MIKISNSNLLILYLFPPTSLNCNDGKITRSIIHLIINHKNMISIKRDQNDDDSDVKDNTQI